MPDTTLVKVYRQLGGSPDPNNDELLGTDSSIISGSWSLPSIDTSGWAKGDHILYAIGSDLAGNISSATSFVVQNWLEGIILEDWADGGLSGQRDSFETTNITKTSEPTGDGTLFSAGRPSWQLQTSGNLTITNNRLVMSNQGSGHPRFWFSHGSDLVNMSGKYTWEFSFYISSGCNKPITCELPTDTATTYPMANMYRFLFRQTGVCQIYKRFNASNTFLGSGTFSNPQGAWHTGRCEIYWGVSGVSDGTMQLYVDDSLKVTVVDATTNTIRSTNMGTWQSMSGGKYISVDWLRQWKDS